MMKMKKMERALCIAALFIIAFAAATVESNGDVNIWPMPASMKNGYETLYLAEEFELITQGSNYSDSLGILKDAFYRMMASISLGHVVDGELSDSSSQLAGLHLVVSSLDDQLQYGIDESYKLAVPSSKNATYAHLEAKTVYGALYGLETFSQLCNFSFTNRLIEVQKSPWTIADKPRFNFRGLLIDTSRHYLPLPIIKNVIDSMAYAKLNVLHWHIVDTQSFPLEIPSYPKLWDGAYSSSERYTMADAADIVSYAQRRGINVMAEIDVPGHAGSWGIGYPDLWPSEDCQQPLDFSNEVTFKIIEGILSDFSKVFDFKFVHLGGDEVNMTCWNTSCINDWLKERGMDQSQAYQYFVLKAQDIALSHGYEIVNWEETFNKFGKNLSRKTVVHNWLGSGVAARVVASGLRCIVSNQDKWYLDHLGTSWKEFYMNEPLANITDSDQQKLVLGGEVCMWGERVDGSDIQQTIWPRAAAAAERLWTPSDKIAEDPKQVAQRLANFRCLLNQRGIAAAPLTGQGRVAPYEPGSCYAQ